MALEPPREIVPEFPGCLTGSATLMPKGSCTARLTNSPDCERGRFSEVGEGESKPIQGSEQNDTAVSLAGACLGAMERPVLQTATRRLVASWGYRYDVWSLHRASPPLNGRRSFCVFCRRRAPRPRMASLRCRRNSPASIIGVMESDVLANPC